MTDDQILRHRQADVRWYAKNREKKRAYKKQYDFQHRTIRPSRACEQCGQLFNRPYGTKKFGRFCSRKCQQQANWAPYYEKHRDRLIAKAQAREMKKRKDLKMSDPKAYTRMRYLEYIKRKYRLSAEQYEQMTAERGKRCDSCRKESVRLLIDHDHATQVVRGLLCNRCNVLAGYLEKNPDILSLTVAYLKKHAKEPSAAA